MTTADHEAQEAITQHWSVTVERNGERVVTIESNCLSGRDISPADEHAIRTAAYHLLAFIGSDHDEAPPAPLGWNVTSNARHEVKERDYRDKLATEIGAEIEARALACTGKDLFDLGRDVLELPIVASLLDFALRSLKTGEG